jgi:hypothetical protein
MNLEALYLSYLTSSLEETEIVVDYINVKNIIEISLYKNIESLDKDASLLTSFEIKEQIDEAKANGFKRLLVHYGYYFNAEYQSVINFSEYINKQFDGDIYFFSPEEIVFLAIRANKTYEEVILDLKRIGVRKVFGYLPKTIIDSNYYANDDELFIEDRHAILDCLIENNIEFQYAFNLGQVEDVDDLKAMYDYVTKNGIKEIVLQPIRLVENHDNFNYEQAQLLLQQILPHFEIPLNMLATNTKIFINNGSYNHYSFDENNKVVQKDPLKNTKIKMI